MSHNIKKSFWCMTCRKEKSADQKSGRKIKPPYVCISCDKELAEKHRESFTAPLKTDTGKKDFQSGRSAAFFKNFRGG